MTFDGGTYVEKPFLIPPEGYPWCVYLHWSNDLVFYAGMGSPRRPFERYNRSSLWRDMLIGFPYYTVEILCWAATKQGARREESRLIRSLLPICNRRLETGIDTWDWHKPQFPSETERQHAYASIRAFEQDVLPVANGRFLVVGFPRHGLKLSATRSRQGEA
jgi:hypothetical protein